MEAMNVRLPQQALARREATIRVADHLKKARKSFFLGLEGGDEKEDYPFRVRKLVEDIPECHVWRKGVQV